MDAKFGSSRIGPDGPIRQRMMDQSICNPIFRFIEPWLRLMGTSGDPCLCKASWHFWRPRRSDIPCGCMRAKNTSSFWNGTPIYRSTVPGMYYCWWMLLIETLLEISICQPLLQINDLSFHMDLLCLYLKVSLTPIQWWTRMYPLKFVPWVPNSLVFNIFS